MNTQNTMGSSYYSNVRSIQNMGVSLFLVWIMKLSIISTCSAEGKFFSVTSTMANLVEIQH